MQIPELFLSRKAVVAALLAVLVVGSAPVKAQYVDEDPVGRLTIGGSIGVISSSMGDVNDNLGIVDQFLQFDEVRATDKINGTLMTSLNLRYKIFETLSLGFSWGGLQNRSELNVEKANLRFFSRATMYSLDAYYHFPGVTDLNERLQLYAGGGLLLLQNGRVEWEFFDPEFNLGNWHTEDPPPPGDLAELSGQGRGTASGNGFHLSGGASFQVSGRLSLAGELGFRFAKLTDIKLDSENVEGYYERFENPEAREPGDWAIWDFFFRDPNSATPDGRKRTDIRDEDEINLENPTGCHDCPLYYTGGALEVDYTGPFALVSIRVHF